MKRIRVSLFCLFTASLVFAQQKVELTGTVYDKETNESIIGVKITCDGDNLTRSDIDGNYKLLVNSNETHTLELAMYGFDTLRMNIKVADASMKKNIFMEVYAMVIDEMIVEAETAKNRETPVAFSKISTKQIEEDLGTRDLPMLLNSTPGAYATEQGGGSGDARVSIRGFDQRNIAVLVDGVPVNDMENGQVYWSNWDGIGDITRYMQVQRGLGASKLAIVSVGGTMNIVTKGIDQKMGGSIKQEVNGYGLFKTSVGYNTGLLKGNWGVTLAGSRKWGNSYADATFTDGWSYFLKVQKKFDKHILSLGVNGAPQSHGQRSNRMPIAVIDKGLAERSGINYQEALDSVAPLNNYTTPSQGARGIKYNPNYGNLNGGIFNEKVNFFHKPQVNLSHSWYPNTKINWTTTAYASVGSGGGTSMKTTPARDTTDGLYLIQDIYDYNTTNFSSIYSTTEHASNNYLRAAHNNHQWFGLLSSFNYNINKSLSTMFGIDGRYYKGSHYQTVYDLMGGDYAIDASDKNQPVGLGYTEYSMKREGDKISYHNDAFVKWGGLFGQIEYKKAKWTAFVTGSFSRTGYKRIDYFKKKDLILADTTIAQAVGFGQIYTHNGTDYTINSPEARNATTEQRWFNGFTLKGGANYNINDHHNVFVNAGYLSIAPKMNTVFDNNNREFFDIENQKVSSVELGYGFKSKKFSANLNGYYTLWINKPPQFTPTVVTPDGVFSYNINGLDALHKGIELDFIYKILKNLELEGLASIADWKTISGSVVQVTDNDNNVVATVDFSAKDVHVGDAAQLQFGGSVRYEIIKDLYVKLRYTYFGKNYANFDPLTLTGANKDRESWQSPSYGLLDFNFGYTLKLWKLKMTLSGSVMNILNTVYISDAQNGSGFNGTSSTVFVGMGRRFSIGLKVAF
jgi:iron complex outermembrane receptor protein